MRGDRERGAPSVLREAPCRANESARSLPGMSECPGIHCKWISFDSEREDRDL